MKPNLFKIEICLTLILAWHCTNAEILSGQSKLNLPISNRTYDSDHVYREINLETQKKAFEMSKGKKILINIYPVKQGKAITSKDMQLKVFFQNAKVSMTDISDQVNKKEFMEESANYASFVKRKNTSAKNIPNIYYTSIDASRLAQADKIGFYFSIKKFHIDYYLLTAKKVQKTPGNQAGICPPCDLSHRKLSILGSDSTGKCPPLCSVGFEIPIEIGHEFKN